MYACSQGVQMGINLQDIKDKHADQIELCENSVTKPS